MFACDFVGIGMNSIAISLVLYTLYSLQKKIEIRSRKLRLGLTVIHIGMLLFYAINFTYWYLNDINDYYYAILIKLWQISGTFMFFILCWLNLDILRVFGVLNPSITKERVAIYKRAAICLYIICLVCFVVGLVSLNSSFSPIVNNVKSFNVDLYPCSYNIYICEHGIW